MACHQMTTFVSTRTVAIMQLVPRGPTSPSPLRIARFDRQCPLHRAVVVVLLKFHRFNHFREPARDASVVFGSPHSQPQGEVFGKRDRHVSHCTRTVYDDSRLHLPVPSITSLRHCGTADPILTNPDPECDALTELNPLFLDRRVRDGVPGGERPLPVEIDHQPSRIAVTSPESVAGHDIHGPRTASRRDSQISKPNLGCLIRVRFTPRSCPIKQDGISGT